MPKNSIKSLRISLACSLFVIFYCIYHFSIPSLEYQEWDSLEYAHAVESQPLSQLWGNHPLGHIIYSAVFQITQFFGYTGRALPVLQQFSIVCFSASMVVFFNTLVSARYSNAIQGFGWTLFLGSGFSFLSSAGTADIYGISLLLMLLALNLLLKVQQRVAKQEALIAGIMIGLATLANQYNGILLGATAMVTLWRKRKHALLIISTTSIVLTGAGYIVFAIVETGSIEPVSWIGWIRDYFGEPTFGQTLDLVDLRNTFDSAAQTILGDPYGWLPNTLKNLGLVLVICLVLLAVSRKSTQPGEDKEGPGIAAFIAVWISGAMLIGWWDAEIVGKFWLLLMPFLTIVLTKGLTRRPQTKFVPIVFGLCLLCFNQYNGVQEMHRPATVFETALQSWSEHTRRDDVIYESTIFTPHLIYWADRPNTLSMHILLYFNDDPQDRFAYFRREFNRAWKSGNDVWYAPGYHDYYSERRLSNASVSVSELMAFFNSYHKRGPVFEYQEYQGGPLKKVYRLFPKPR